MHTWSRAHQGIMPVHVLNQEHFRSQKAGMQKSRKQQGVCTRASGKWTGLRNAHTTKSLPGHKTCTHMQSRARQGTRHSQTQSRA
eukprot:scaffold72120_cov15-Tisochrysis_lutea.AAC.1